MKEYTSEINIWFGGNNHEAESEEDYIKKVKDQFWEEFGIKLTNAEITNIQKKWVNISFCFIENLRKMKMKNKKIIEKIKKWLMKERFSNSSNMILVKHNNQLLLEYIEKLNKKLDWLVNNN